MALPVVASTSSNSAASATVVVTAPTGIAIGDLLIGSYTSFRTGGDTTNPAIPAGFTEIRKGRVQNDEGAVTAFFKVAVLADVSAANYSFTSSLADHVHGAMMRITGAAVGSEITVSEVDLTLSGNGSTTVSWTGASTPLVGQSLAVMCVGGLDFSIASVVTTSGYNSTPTVTWTERADLGNRNGASDGASHAVATAPYTGATQFTQYGYNTSLVFASVVGILFLVNAPQSVTPNVSHLNVAPSLLGLAATNTVSAPVSHLEIVPTINGMNTKLDNPLWTPQVKTATTWTPEIK